MSDEEQRIAALLARFGNLAGGQPVQKQARPSFNDSLLYTSPAPSPASVRSPASSSVSYASASGSTGNLYRVQEEFDANERRKASLRANLKEQRKKPSSAPLPPGTVTTDSPLMEKLSFFTKSEKVRKQKEDISALIDRTQLLEVTQAMEATPNSRDERELELARQQRRAYNEHLKKLSDIFARVPADGKANDADLKNLSGRVEAWRNEIPASFTAAAEVAKPEQVSQTPGWSGHDAIVNRLIVTEYIYSLGLGKARWAACEDIWRAYRDASHANEALKAEYRQMKEEVEQRLNERIKALHDEVPKSAKRKE